MRRQLSPAKRKTEDCQSAEVVFHLLYPFKPYRCPRRFKGIEVVEMLTFLCEKRK